MNGEMVAFGSPGPDSSFGDASGLGDNADLALFLQHQNGDDKTPRKKRPRKSSAGSAMKGLDGTGLCIPINIREDFNAVDLTYPLDAESTIFWPGSGPESFRLCMNCYSNPQQGFEYYAGTFNCAEHAGTHVDAPYHFHKDGMTVDNLSLSHLMGPAVVLDIKHKMHPIEINGNYALHAEDILHFEATNGMLKPGTMVIVRTGWSKFYALGPKAYLGYDEKTQGPYNADLMPLCFPGIGEDAARILVDRRVAAVGIDTGMLRHSHSVVDLIPLSVIFLPNSIAGPRICKRLCCASNSPQRRNIWNRESKFRSGEATVYRHESSGVSHEDQRWQRCSSQSSCTC